MPWRFASSPQARSRTPLEEALAVAAREPTHDGTPVQRWLRHFDLPLTAAWSSQPRGLLVLLSPARGWRQPEEALAQQLAAGRRPRRRHRRAPFVLAATIAS